MKNEKYFFGLPVETIAYSPEPEAQRVSPDTLKQWVGVDKEIRKARSLAARTIRNARKRNSQLMLNAQKRAAEERERQQIQFEQANMQCREKLLSETVSWLVEEQDMEQHLFEAAMMKAQTWAAEILQAWGGEADWQAMMHQRIKPVLSQLKNETNLTLALPTQASVEAFLASQQRSADKTQLALQTVVDPTLSEGQARLGNALVQISIDMQTELEQLVSQLRHQPMTTLPMKAVDDYEQN